MCNKLLYQCTWKHAWFLNCRMGKHVRQSWEEFEITGGRVVVASAFSHGIHLFWLSLLKISWGLRERLSTFNVAERLLCDRRMNGAWGPSKEVFQALKIGFIRGEGPEKAHAMVRGPPDKSSYQIGRVEKNSLNVYARAWCRSKFFLKRWIRNLKWSNFKFSLNAQTFLIDCLLF